jgi:trehalose 6-phosphate phosphatase
MRHILAKRHVQTLVQFASSNVLLAFDYDGTLASITRDPAHARLRDRTRRLLTAVAQRYPCVVISGRRWEDIAKRLARVPVWYVFGNHGLEPWSPHPEYATRVREWVQQLEGQLTPYPGVIVEDKTYSVAVHYRRARRKREVLKAINNAVRELRGSRVLGGKQVVNLVPRGAPHKGMALEWVRQRLACDCAIYVGDDETDEDVFDATPHGSLLSIRVGPTRTSCAPYYLRTQRELDALLSILVSLRPQQACPD